MKPVNTIFCIILFGCIVMNANGQTEKGTFFIGAQNLSELQVVKKIFGTGISTKFNSSEYSVTPILGYFVGNNFGIGLIPSYHHEIEDLIDFEERVNDSFSLIPFIRYYIGNGEFKPFLNLGVGYHYRRSIYEADYTIDVTSKANTIIYNVGTGVSYFIHKKISLDLGLNYNSSNYSIKNHYEDAPFPDDEVLPESKYALFSEIRNALKMENSDA